MTVSAAFVVVGAVLVMGAAVGSWYWWDQGRGAAEGVVQVREDQPVKDGVADGSAEAPAGDEAELPVETTGEGTAASPGVDEPVAPVAAAVPVAVPAPATPSPATPPAEPSPSPEPSPTPEADPPAEVAAAPERTYTLRLGSKPPGARVQLDGVALPEATPLVGVELPGGTHTLRMVRGDDSISYTFAVGAFEPSGHTCSFETHRCSSF